MQHETIDTIKYVGTSFLFTGGGIVISLQDFESYLRILSLLIGITTTLFIFYKNQIKKPKKDDQDL